MQHINGNLARHRNIILKGFDPVSAQGFTQVPNFILRSKKLSVGAKLTSIKSHKAQVLPQAAMLHQLGITFTKESKIPYENGYYPCC